MKLTLISNHKPYEGLGVQTEPVMVEADETCISIVFPAKDTRFMEFISGYLPEAKFFDSIVDGLKSCILDRKDFSMKIFP